MQEPTDSDVIKDLHADLARKYKRHGSTLERLWRSFDQKQRAKCVKAGMMDGVLLKHPRDVSLGNVYKMLPDWNLRDLTEKPEHLLSMLEHRAKSTLVEQYWTGPNGGQGDYAIIDESVRTRNLRHVEAFKDCWTFFLDDDQNYGRSFKILSDHKEVRRDFAAAMQAKLCIPQATGEFVLIRQVNILQYLNILVEDILEEGSKERRQKQLPKNPDESASAALSKLSIRDSPVKLSLPDLVAGARDQAASCMEHLDLYSEPTVLAHTVNLWFFSRPELLPDEKGRRMGVHTDKYISAVVFDVLHNAVTEAAIWDYIHQLLARLEALNNDKAHRTILLQEISNVCQLAYVSAQGLFKRNIQVKTGAKWYKRVSNAYDSAGNARVTLKGNPGDLTRSDPQLHYVLRLCHPDTTASKAIEWLKKLTDLQQSHPSERERLDESEFESLCKLAATVAFIQDLSGTVTLPAPSRKKGMLFVSRSQELGAELSNVKTDLDLRDFAAPIDTLLEPGMTEGALKALDQFVVNKAGAKLGFLYQDLVDECFSDLQNQYDQYKAKIEAGQKEWTPLPVPVPEPRETLIQQRKQKEKTRPSHSSTYDISPQAEPALENAVIPQTFKVSAGTAEVFGAFFGKSESRGAVSWAAFQGAMAEIGFSVLPKYGSVFTFLPPETMSVKRSFTVHRPHKSDIEGYVRLIYARRLTRAYGWDEKTFAVV
ncbi:hypothetical protein CGRA01v4_05158 [Colletotrichum graminicola]|uniref:Ipa protein n=1 Tax=Colletotrichum graminicola (strain M1.001 / M2 / FGSC 10212) TaxID=645133 RepID=E3QEU1_COLGM|nr:uncharacterized protein GLRG_04541 [Colletotrichum graminicola M1.001]EFQ29397.1 hypothetical protein GLRG_04541 [Colletotrichum graminicola M1.001]WDK13877.1 hypothetical protein CGRA01v4_05158 [Colletotrichum graminicola]